jgi:hypothetical protein
VIDATLPLANQSPTEGVAPGTVSRMGDGRGRARQLGLVVGGEGAAIRVCVRRGERVRAGTPQISHLTRGSFFISA